MKRHINTAYDWHGGQSSALYSFASSGGVVWSADHREDLEHEITPSIPYARFQMKDEREAQRLLRLLDYISKAKVGYCYESGRMMPRRRRK